MAPCASSFSISCYYVLFIVFVHFLVFIEQSMCHPNPCKNLGICTELEREYECTCQPGYKGINCECKWRKTFQYKLSFCDTFHHYFLLIVNFLLAFWLTDLVPDPCTPSPCKNGAICAQVGNSYYCQCKTGWIGKECGSRFILLYTTCQLTSIRD